MLIVAATGFASNFQKKSASKYGLLAISIIALVTYCYMGYMRQSAESIFAVFPLLAVLITPILGSYVDHKGKAASMLVLGSVLLIACHLTFAFVLPLFKTSAVGGIIKHNNELDVCFMKANKLFVIECKTGVTSESLFNEIVYKVCALKEVLLGTSNSYIFSLKKDHKGNWKKTAKYMGITFCDWLNLTKPELLKNILKSMDKIAKER